MITLTCNVLLFYLIFFSLKLSIFSCKLSHGRYLDNSVFFMLFSQHFHYLVYYAKSYYRLNCLGHENS